MFRSREGALGPEGTGGWTGVCPSPRGRKSRLPGLVSEAHEGGPRCTVAEGTSDSGGPPAKVYLFIQRFNYHV